MQGSARLACRLGQRARAVRADPAAQVAALACGSRGALGTSFTLGTLRADSALRGQEDLPRLSGQRNLAAQQALADPGHLAVQQDQAVQEVLQVPRVRPAPSGPCGPGLLHPTSATAAKMTQDVKSARIRRGLEAIGNDVG